MADELGEATVRLTGEDRGLASAIDSAQSKLGGSIFVMRSAGQSLQNLGNVAINGFSAAVKSASEFDASLVRMQNLSALSDLNLNKVHDSLLKISDESGRAPQEVADGFYYAASVLGKTNDALAVTEAVSKAAAIGLGDMGDITQAVTGIMSAYGMHADQVNHIMEVLLVAVKDGTGEASDYATALGRITPLAAAAGISIDDVAAAMAAATRSGLSVDESATAVRRVIQELISPSQKAAQEMATLGFSQDALDKTTTQLTTTFGPLRTHIEGLGVDAGKTQTILRAMTSDQVHATAMMRDAGLSTKQAQQILAEYNGDVDKTRQNLIGYGLANQDVDKVVKAFITDQADVEEALGKTGISATQLRDVMAQPGGLYMAMQLIQQATGGNTAEMARLFPNVRALIGILADAGAQGQAYGDILKEMGSDSNLLGQDFARTQDTLAFKSEKANAEMQRLSITFGEKLAPDLVRIIDDLSPLIDKFTEYIDKHPEAVTRIAEVIAVLAVLINALGRVMTIVSGAMAVFRGLSFIIGGFSAALDFLAPILFEIAGAIDVVIEVVGGLAAAIAAIVGLPVEIVVAIAAVLVAIGLILAFDWFGIRTKIWNGLVSVWHEIHPALSAAKKAVLDFVSDLPAMLGGAFSALGSTAHNLIGAIGPFFSSLGRAAHNGVAAAGRELNALPGQIANALQRGLTAAAHFASQLPYLIGFALGRAVRDIIGGFNALVNFIHSIPGRLVSAWNSINRGVTELVARLNSGLHLAHDLLVLWFTMMRLRAEALVRDMWTSVTTWFGNMWRDVSALAVRLVNDTMVWIQQLPSRAEKEVHDTHGRLVTWFNAMRVAVVATTINLINDVTNWFAHLPSNVANLVSQARNAAVNGFNNMVDGVRSALQNMVNVTTDMWNRIISFVQGIGGRLRSMAESAAKNFVQGFIAGLQPGSPFLPERAMMQIADTVVERASHIHDTIRNLNRNVSSYSLPGLGAAAGAGVLSNRLSASTAGANPLGYNIQFIINGVTDPEWVGEIVDGKLAKYLR